MKRVAITGGTGALGQALTARLLADGVERLVIYSRDEHKQAAMAARFRDAEPLRFFIGDVRDQARLIEAFYGIDAILHCAALKRVDAGAYNPGELIKTNVCGTANVIAAAVDAGVPRVLVISSDKAVSALTAYGASKFMAECYATAINAVTVPRGTRVSVVRYGNVIDSTGSVLHTWRTQVAQGRPLTLTDPRMTRFILTLADAPAIVLGALTQMEGGEVFVPALPSVEMAAIARVLNAHHEPPYVVTGLRGAEKLNETLISADEAQRTIYVAPRGPFVILPATHSWRRDGDWIAGDSLPSGFAYTSDGNSWWLRGDDLTALLARTKS